MSASHCASHDKGDDGLLLCQWCSQGYDHTFLLCLFVLAETKKASFWLPDTFCGVPH